MKKIITWMAFLAIILCLVVPSSATEITDDTTATDTTTETVENETVNLPTEEEIEDLGTEVYNTLFTRVYEFIETNKDGIIMILGFAASIFITIRDARKRKKTTDDASAVQTAIQGDVSAMKNVQNAVIDVVNNLSAKYAEMKEKYGEYESVEDERNKLVGAVMLQNQTILEILTSVYANSKNLPQGEKDIILYKYSKCLSALDDDNALRSCVEAVHAALGEHTKDTEDA